MRLGLQAKPTAADAIDGINRDHVLRNPRSAYALRATTTLSTGNENPTIHLGVSPYAGSVVALSINVSQTQTGGSVLARVRINGSITLTATIDGTNQDTHVVTAVPGTHAVAANQTVEIEILASSFTPTSTEVYVQALLTNEDHHQVRRTPDYAAAYLSGTGPDPAIAINSPLVLDAANGSHGSSVAFNLSTGAITLTGGGQYLVFLTSPANSDSLVEIWDLTAAAAVAGCRLKTMDVGSGGSGYGASGHASLATVLEPSTTRDYEFRVIQDTASPRTGSRAGLQPGTGATNEVVHALIIRLA